MEMSNISSKDWQLQSKVEKEGKESCYGINDNEKISPNKHKEKKSENKKRKKSKRAYKSKKRSKRGKEMKKSKKGKKKRKHDYYDSSSSPDSSSYSSEDFSDSGDGKELTKRRKKQIKRYKENHTCTSSSCGRREYDNQEAIDGAIASNEMEEKKAQDISKSQDVDTRSQGCADQNVMQSQPGAFQPSSSKRRQMIPMSREQYEAQQKVVREVYDPDTRRFRLVRGTGEIIERIVTKQDHERINRQATRYDGVSYAKSVWGASKR